MSDERNPMGEGSENTAVGPGSVAERRAAEHPTADDGTQTGGGTDELAYDPDEPRGEIAEQGGQPNLDSAPTVAGRPTRLDPASTDDSPGQAV